MWILPGGSIGIYSQKTLIIFELDDFIELADTGGGISVEFLQTDGGPEGCIPLGSLSTIGKEEPVPYSVSWADLVEEDLPSEASEGDNPGGSSLPSFSVNSTGKADARGKGNPGPGPSEKGKRGVPPRSTLSGGMPVPPDKSYYRGFVPVIERTPNSDSEWVHLVGANRKELFHPLWMDQFRSGNVNFNKVRFASLAYHFNEDGSKELVTDLKYVDPPVSVAGAKKRINDKFSLFSE
jgi:hypothetical protein